MSFLSSHHEARPDPFSDDDAHLAQPWVPSRSPTLRLVRYPQVLDASLDRFHSECDPDEYPSILSPSPDDADADDRPFMPRQSNPLLPSRHPHSLLSVRSPSPSFSDFDQYPHFAVEDDDGDDDQDDSHPPHPDLVRIDEAQHARSLAREHHRASQESDASQDPVRRKLPQPGSPPVAPSFDPARTNRPYHPPSPASLTSSHRRSSDRDPYVPSTSPPHHPRPPTHYNLSRYPAYDEHNRRIGLEHLHHDVLPPRSSLGSSAYYRPHTRDYPRPAPSPTNPPSNGTSSLSSNHPRPVNATLNGTGPVNESIQGPRQRADHGQGREQHSQSVNAPRQADNGFPSQSSPAVALRPASGSPALPPVSVSPAPPPPRASLPYTDLWEGDVSPDVDANGASVTTDHLRHLLHISEDVSIGLHALVDPPPGEKPNYPLPTLIKLAIYGSPRRKLTLQEIYAALEDRFVWFRENTHDMAWKNSIRHNLSLRKCFKRVQRPITEPGKGSYWMIDVSQGEGNKRQRKRNKKPTKAQLAAQQQQQKEEQSNAFAMPRNQQNLTYQYNPFSNSYQFDPSSQPSQPSQLREIDDNYDDYDDHIMSTPRLHPVHPSSLPDSQPPPYRGPGETPIDPVLRNGAPSSGSLRTHGRPIAASSRHSPYASSASRPSPFPDLAASSQSRSFPASSTSSHMGVPQLPRASSASLKLPDLPAGPPPRQYGHRGLGLGHASDTLQVPPALVSRSESPRRSPFARDSRTPEFLGLPPINTFDRAPSSTSSVSTSSPATAFALPNTLGFGQHPNARALGGPVRRSSTALELPEPVKKNFEPLKKGALQPAAEANEGMRRTSKFVPPQKSQSSGSWLRDLEARGAEVSDEEEGDEDEEEEESDG